MGHSIWLWLPWNRRSKSEARWGKRSKNVPRQNHNKDNRTITGNDLTRGSNLFIFYNLIQVQFLKLPCKFKPNDISIIVLTWRILTNIYQLQMILIGLVAFLALLILIHCAWRCYGDIISAQRPTFVSPNDIYFTPKTNKILARLDNKNGKAD